MLKNSFSGKEAVSWTLKYLQEHRDSLFDAKNATQITREKVELLMQKFLEQKIFEDVSGGQSSRQFRDSSRRLYIFRNRFVQQSPAPPTLVHDKETPYRPSKLHRGSLTLVSTSRQHLTLIDLSTRWAAFYVAVEWTGADPFVNVTDGAYLRRKALSG